MVSINGNLYLSMGCGSSWLRRGWLESSIRRTVTWDWYLLRSKMICGIVWLKQYFERRMRYLSAEWRLLVFDYQDYWNSFFDRKKFDKFIFGDGRHRHEVWPRSRHAFRPVFRDPWNDWLLNAIGRPVGDWWTSIVNTWDDFGVSGDLRINSKPFWSSLGLNQNSLRVG